MTALGELSAARRLMNLDDMRAEPLDILVIGGGITGAGIALDAAVRGYRVGLIERNDFASGTSGWSTKLVHGGIRYLPQFDVPLVREALHERGYLLANAPYLVHPLAFVLPLYAESRHPVGLPIAPPGGIGLGLILDAGLALYDALAGRENVRRHRRISRREVLREIPDLRPEGLESGFVYYDAQTNDTRLTLAVLRTAASRGALLANYCAAVGFLRDDEALVPDAPDAPDGTSGRIAGVVARSTLPTPSSTEPRADIQIRARYVVNATGVWAEETEHLAGEESELRIAPSKGTHIVLAKEALGIGDEAVVLPETEDGRIIFVVPWQSRALVGTTDTEVEDIEAPAATEDEITYLLEHLNRYFERTVTRKDILATYAGNRPLLRLARTRTPSRLSRTHAIVESADGLISISGGKLTTYRRMAQDVLDRIDEHQGRAPTHPTMRLPLLGARGWAQAQPLIAQEAVALGLDTAIQRHLEGAYGAEALDVLDLVAADPSLGVRLACGLPYLRAEVVRATRAEMALAVTDVLYRRTRLALEDGSYGTAEAGIVADLMARELGWTPAQRAQSLAEYAAYARHQAGPLANRLVPVEDAASLAPRTSRA